MWKWLKQRRGWQWALAGIGGGGLVLAVWLGLLIFTDLPTLDRLTTAQLVPSARILARDGRLLYQIIDPAGTNHATIPLDDIPLACQQATIATEDASFYQNPGVDLRGIVRSLWINLQGGEVLAGGSTITQQVAKNMLLDPQERAERTLLRKARESVLAWRIGQAYSKDEILALYLNQTYYGQLAYGVETAAQTYFGVPAVQLDLAQCALLAGLPQAPGVYNPFYDLPAAQARQKVVLGLMVRAGYITEAEAEEAARQPLRLAGNPFGVVAPHFVFKIWRELEATYGPEVLYSGLTVTTTLDADLQRVAEQVIQAQLAQLAESPISHNAGNAALVAMQPDNGQILAYVGSANYFNPQISGAVDMAFSARQPGSALKPFTYALALDPTRCGATSLSLCPWTAATVLYDVRTSFPTREGTPYVPLNYDRTFNGPVPVRQALAGSLNIPAVLTLETVGVPNLLHLLRQGGVTTLGDPTRYGLALTLGGGEVRLAELVGAYGLFANQGQYVPPVSVLRIESAEFGVLYDWQPSPPRPVIDPQVAYLINDILSDNLARVATFGEFSRLSIGRPAAVKTGTTTDFRDNWTVGYTPQLLVGVWVGNADYSPMIALSGVDGAAPIWHRVMRLALVGKPQVWYQPPGEWVRQDVCGLSGLLPTPDCAQVQNEIFIAGTEPSDYDTVYQRVWVDIATGLPATADTPPERTISEVRLQLPAVVVPWALAQGWPVLLASQPTIGSDAPPLAISYPDPNSTFRLSAVLPANAQQITLAAVNNMEFEVVQFVLNGNVIEEVTTPPYQVRWSLELGDQRLLVRGRTAAGQWVTSPEITFRVLPP